MGLRMFLRATRGVGGRRKAAAACAIGFGGAAALGPTQAASCDGLDGKVVAGIVGGFGLGWLLKGYQPEPWRAAHLPSVPHEIDRRVEELAEEVRGGALTGEQAVLELCSSATGILRRIDTENDAPPQPGSSSLRLGLECDFRTSPEPGWAAARRIRWGVARLLKLGARPTGCTYVHYGTGACTLSPEGPPPQPSGTVRFVIVSDTHLRHRDLPALPGGCDVLVHCGDVLLQGGDEQPRAGSSGDITRRAILADVADWLGKSGAASVLVRVPSFRRVLQISCFLTNEGKMTAGRRQPRWAAREQKRRRDRSTRADGALSRRRSYECGWMLRTRS